MRITTRGRYAVRASVALARLQKPNSPISITSLAKEEDISSIFLEQIFFRLRKAGIVASVRGPGGGFYFAKSPENVSIKEILAAVGENLDLNFCDRHAKDCDCKDFCSSHTIWEEITTIVSGYLENLSLAMVVKREASMNTMNTDTGNTGNEAREDGQ
jgi:Rrf2 family iron-sulfur cluster assembly transcriptional regulator